MTGNERARDDSADDLLAQLDDASLKVTNAFRLGSSHRMETASMRALRSMAAQRHGRLLVEDMNGHCVIVDGDVEGGDAAA
jgi:hypothetical protein